MLYFHKHKKYMIDFIRTKETTEVTTYN